MKYVNRIDTKGTMTENKRLLHNNKQLLEEIVGRLHTFSISDWKCTNQYNHNTSDNINHFLIDGKYKYNIESNYIWCSTSYRLTVYKKSKEVFYAIDESGRLLYPIVKVIEKEEKTRVERKLREEKEREDKKNRHLQEELLKTLPKKK